MFKFRRKTYKQITAENDLTPLEVKARLGSLSSLRSDFEIAGHLRRQSPKRFLREAVATGVTLYSARQDAETLLVGFNGRARRPMVPISVLLQMLDDERFDVLLLTDGEKNHYANGIRDYADTFVTLTDKVRRVAQAGGYRSIVTFGTSMGGLPALRAGRILSARRAVSVGGRFAWQISRLQTIGEPGAPTGTFMDAFDPLCHCLDSRTQCINVFGEGHLEDARHSRALQAMFPACRTIPVPIAEHNPIHLCFELGRLGEFFQELFAAEDPSVDFLRSLFEPAPTL